MGLDMYALKVDKKYKTPAIAGTVLNCEEIYYWRKNRFMHNLIEIIYRKKGGKDDFNRVHVELDNNDIDFIEAAIKNGTIDKMDAPGYFFGNQEYNDERRAYDIEFVLKARQVIKDGYKVYYYPWW